MHRLAVAPIIEVFDHQQSEDSLTWRGVATSDERQRIPGAQVGSNLLVVPIVIEERVELTQDRIGVLSEFWDTSKHVFKGVAIDEHRSAGSSGR